MPVYHTYVSICVYQYYMFLNIFVNTIIIYDSHISVSYLFIIRVSHTHGSYVFINHTCLSCLLYQYIYIYICIYIYTCQYLFQYDYHTCLSYKFITYVYHYCVLYLLIIFVHQSELLFDHTCSPIIFVCHTCLSYLFMNLTCLSYLFMNHTCFSYLFMNHILVFIFVYQHVSYICSNVTFRRIFYTKPTVTTWQVTVVEQNAEPETNGTSSWDGLIWAHPRFQWQINVLLGIPYYRSTFLWDFSYVYL